MTAELECGCVVVGEPCRNRATQEDLLCNVCRAADPGRHGVLRYHADPQKSYHVNLVQPAAVPVFDVSPR